MSPEKQTHLCSLRKMNVGGYRITFRPLLMYLCWKHYVRESIPDPERQSLLIQTTIGTRFEYSMYIPTLL